MKFEHFALNVPDCRAQSKWYVDHMGFSIAWRREDSPYTHFLADETGRIIIEFYSNPKAPVPDYKATHPLNLHIAFVATDARAVRKTLEAAGATFALEDAQPDGTILVMLRDPWGVPIQFCQRAKPLGGKLE